MRSPSLRAAPQMSEPKSGATWSPHTLGSVVVLKFVGAASAGTGVAQTTEKFTFALYTSDCPTIPCTHIWSNVGAVVDVEIETLSLNDNVPVAGIVCGPLSASCWAPSMNRLNVNVNFVPGEPV